MRKSFVQPSTAMIVGRASSDSAIDDMLNTVYNVILNAQQVQTRIFSSSSKDDEYLDTITNLYCNRDNIDGDSSRAYCYYEGTSIFLKLIV